MEEIHYKNARIIITDRQDGNVRSPDCAFYNTYQHTHQVHGHNIVYTSQTEIDNTNQEKADGLITNTILPIGVKVADCNGVIFIGEHHVGAIHAGRRSANQGIIPRAITMMIEHGELAKHIQIYIGPSLRKCCMEVGADGTDFTQLFPEPYIEKRGAKQYLDLVSYITDQCTEHGILAQNITVHPDCTGCTETYFSYRKGDTSARCMLGVRKK